MFKLLAFGLGVGAAVQAWRAFPPLSPVTGDAVAVCFVLGLVCAYLGGRWHGRGGAVATAVAVASAESHATAQSAVNVLVMTGERAGDGHGFAIPTENAPWLQGAQERRAITVDDLDGMDMSEIVGESAEEKIQ